MVKKDKKELESVKPEEKEDKNTGVEARKRKRKISKVSRYSGAIMFLVCLLIALMLWISGEFKSGVTQDESMRKNEDSASSSIIIVE